MTDGTVGPGLAPALNADHPTNAAEPQPAGEPDGPEMAGHLLVLALFGHQRIIEAVGAARQQVVEACESHRETVERPKRGAEFLDGVISGRERELTSFMDRDGHKLRLDRSGPAEDDNPGARVLDFPPGGNPALSSSMSACLQLPPYADVWQAQNRVFNGHYRRRLQNQLDRYVIALRRMRRARDKFKGQLEQATAARAAHIAGVRDTVLAALENAVQQHVSAANMLPVGLRPWSHPAWESRSWVHQAPLLGSVPLCLGTMRAQEDPELGLEGTIGAGILAPLLITNGESVHLAHSTNGRAAVHAMIRSMLIRLLVTTRPGDVRLTFFDPAGLGQSVAPLLELAEYDVALIGGKIWSATADLRQVLAEHTVHVEQVIQRYLRSTYGSIEEYNTAAGQVAEPYRYLVVFDFPRGFDEETTADLLRLMENGPRCGVRVILVTDAESAEPIGVSRAEVFRRIPPILPERGLVHRTGSLDVLWAVEMDSDLDGPPGVLQEVVEHVGRGYLERDAGAVTFDSVFALFRDAAARRLPLSLPPEAASADPADPGSWWPCSSVEAITAPLGRSGARDAATLTFDSGGQAGALLVGRPGSGKSTLLHSYLAALTTLYGPEELELYLIDFKEGVEFQVYAREALPHARCVAIESDREFGLSILQSLEAELRRRGELLRAAGRHSGLAELRRATGVVLPRILLVFDEFQVLFARPDKLGAAAAGLLENLVRQGRSFGIHVLLGSQSLAGMDALGGHVPQLLPVRILLPATDSDAQRVLGEGNTAGQLLTRTGEGILNTAGGAVEASRPFRGALSDEAERRQRVARLRSKADAAGFTRRPVVFEGNAATPIESLPPAHLAAEVTAGGSAGLPIRVGSPMVLHGSADIPLRREPGANILVVARDARTDEDPSAAQGSVPRSLLVLAACSLELMGARAELIDLTPIDSGVDALLSPLVADGRITVHRRRVFADVLRTTRERVRDRLAADDVTAPPRILMIYGLHRSRELDADTLDGDPELSDSLEEILRDGPEVGVHTWIWCETVSGLNRRLPSPALREFAWRITGRQSTEDAQRLLGSAEAAELREPQILLVNDDHGIARRFTTYTVPSTDWLADLTGTQQWTSRRTEPGSRADAHDRG